MKASSGFKRFSYAIRWVVVLFFSSLSYKMKTITTNKLKSWTQNFDRKWKTIFLTSYYCFSTRLPFLRIFYLFLFPSYENVFIFDAKWIMKNEYEKILLAFNSGSSWLREKKEIEKMWKKKKWSCGKTNSKTNHLKNKMRNKTKRNFFIWL